MGTKTISIMDDVYERLKAPEESFSDELRRLTERKGDILQFAGMWKDIPKEEFDKFEKALKESRKETRIKEVLERMGA